MKSTAPLMPYGNHFFYTSHGNTVACRYCSKLNEVPSAKPGKDYCWFADEFVSRDGRCFGGFDRAVGSDDA